MVRGREVHIGGISSGRSLPWTAVPVLLLLLILPSIMVPATTVAADPKDDVVLRAVVGRDYDQRVDLGDEARFTWVLVNLNTTATYNTTVRAFADRKGWKVSVEEGEGNVGPTETRVLTVSARSDDGKDGEVALISVSIIVVHIGTGATHIINATATARLDYSLSKGLDLLFWHVDLPAELDNPLGRFLILVFLWSIAVYVLIVAILDGVFRFLVRKTDTKADDIVLDIIRRPAIVLSIGYGIIDTLEVLDIPRSWVSDAIRYYTILVIAVAAYVVYKILKDVLIYYGDEHAKRTKNQAMKMIVPLVNNIISVIIVVAAASFMLSYLGYDITVAVAGLGVMGLVIAFAAQDTLSNFFSGIHLLVDRPFQKGDLVILETGEMCTVRDIGFRSARLYDVMEHVMITLPNNRLANAKIVNITAPDFNYRMRLEVSVAYGSDVDLVKRTLLNAPKGYPGVIQDRDGFEPRVRFKRFGDSSLNFDLFVWIEDIRAENYLIMNRVRSDLNERIDEAFRRNKIKIPFPQRELWVSSMPPGREGKEGGAS